MVVCLITVLVIIRYWIIASIDRVSERDRYTVIVTSDFGTYTFTGAKVDFVPSRKSDDDPVTNEWTAITDAFTDDNVVISSTRVCKGVEVPEDMYGVDSTAGKNRFEDIEKDYPPDFYKPGDVKGDSRFQVVNYGPGGDISQDLFGVPSEDYLSVAPVVPKGPLMHDDLGIHIAPPKVYQEGDPAAHKPGPWPRPAPKLGPEVPTDWPGNIPIEEDDRVVDDSTPKILGEYDDDSILPLTRIEVLNVVLGDMKEGGSAGAKPGPKPLPDAHERDEDGVCVNCGDFPEGGKKDD